MKGSTATRSEQLIGTVVPPALPRPEPTPSPLPILPFRRTPTGNHVLPSLDMARLDRSGRLSARAILKQLRWSAGHRVDVDVIDGALVVASAVDGAHVVGCRGELALPAAARAQCGITTEDPVMIAAYPLYGLAAIYPAIAVARLIHQLHTTSGNGDAG